MGTDFYNIKGFVVWMCILMLPTFIASVVCGFLLMLVWNFLASGIFYLKFWQASLIVFVLIVVYALFKDIFLKIISKNNV